MLRAALKALKKHSVEPETVDPQPSFPRRSSPEQMAVIATLFGITPAAVDSCAIVEIGSSSGLNLLALAERFPNAHFLGLDASTRNIGRATAIAKELKLDNIEFRQAETAAVKLKKSSIDYLIVNPQFSSFDNKIKAAMVKLCEHALRDNGVALFGYSTLPGSVGELLRGSLMRFHSGQYQDPSFRAHQARTVFNYVAANATDKPYQEILAREEKSLQLLNDSQLNSEIFEAPSHPLYFSEFVALFGNTSLHYLGDLDISSMLPLELPPAVQQELGKIAGDVIRLEQYLDFIRNRKSRRSLICKSAAPIRQELTPKAVEKVRIASALIPTDQQFTHPDGRKFLPPSPLVAKALRELARVWPNTFSLRDLALKLSVGSGSELDSSQLDHLAAAFMQMYLAKLIEFRTVESNFGSSLTLFPLSSRLAQLLLHTGEITPNMGNDFVRLGATEKRIIALCNGTRNRETLMKEAGLQTTDQVERVLLTLKRAGLIV